MTDVLGGAALTVSGVAELLIVVKATVIVTIALLGAALMRRARSSERHVLLASTFAILLALPVVNLLMPAVSIAITTAPVSYSTTPAATIPRDQPAEPNADAALRSFSPAAESQVSLRTLLRVVWATVAMFFAAPVAVALCRLRHVRSRGVRWLKGESIARRIAQRAGVHRRVDVLLHEDVVVPMTCGFTQPAIILPTDAEYWDEAALQRAIVHEIEHVRRADWPLHLAARVVLSLYWFHPLVWNAWRRLCLESERACDDAVLCNAERTEYAEQLVALARRLSHCGIPPVLSMASRSDLSARIAALLDSDQPRGRARLFRSIAAIASAVMVVATISPLRAISATQSTVSSAGDPAFEVASIKSNVSGALRVSIQVSPGGRFTAINAPLGALIRHAYGLQQFELAGGPKWLDSDRFDIAAKAEGEPAPAQMRLMLRTLLADRFKLQLRSETRELPTYALVIARNDRKPRPGLRRTESDCAPAASLQDVLGISAPSGPRDPDAPCGFFGPGPGGSAKFRGVTIEVLARFLAPAVHRPVFDRTGLTGYFDADLEMTAEFGPPPPPPGVPDRFDRSSLPSIFTAIQEQLGLKLDAQRGPVTVFVIDRLEHPTEK
jgi:bla regulator protein blaR1